MVYAFHQCKLLQQVHYLTEEIQVWKNLTHCPVMYLLEVIAVLWQY